MYKKIIVLCLLLLPILFTSCKNKTEKQQTQKQTKIDKLLANYADVKLTADLSILSENQKKMIPLLFEAAKIIDELYWIQTCGNKEKYLKSIPNEKCKEYFYINYGPWDRLNGMKPFIDDVGTKPDGANFYPVDMTYQEFDTFDDLKKFDSYTLLRRNEVGGLKTVPYHEAYKNKLVKISELMEQAASLAEDNDFKNYLLERAKALLTDDYYQSNIAWMMMKDNILDFIVGPIEDIDDRLYFSKASYQSMLLVKDVESSKNMEKYSLLVPFLQKNLPVDEKYKTEIPGALSDIMVYDVIYCSGNWNAGSKKIAITLPRDGRVQLAVGSRKLQFKNVIQAKFEKILKPIAHLLIDKNQREHVKFDAFFQNTMFYEVGSALGIKNMVTQEGSVRDGLKEHFNVIEECKNDILSLFFLTKLHEMGELPETDLMDNYVTYMADIFRSVRFGISNDQGVANMIRFYYFEEKGAFTRNKKFGTYTIDFEKMQDAMLQLAEEILLIQGNGDYEKAKRMVEEKGYIRDELLEDLYRIQKEQIPKDIVFKQGLDVLGLEK
ncbi:MAG: Zn-dependent hydrolase [Bacteroidota bacterium]|nr:Zn-dependent hydrolase [Bacteroidota bacterium]